MDERLKETLSAMMDDEADELSVRRLLSHGNQDDVCGQWQRWQQIRDLMHENHGPAEGVDVAAAVRDRLDGRAQQPSGVVGTEHRTRVNWHWPVTAMVALALVVGFGAGAGWDSSQPGGTANELPVALSEEGLPVLPVSIEEVALQGLDEEQLRQMRQFMLEHAQHNSVGVGRGSVGYARMVSANNGY